MTLIIKVSLIILTLLANLSIAKAEPTALTLSECPSSPNCVSSQATDEGHQLPVLTLKMSANEAWPLIISEVEKLPRTTILRQNGQYLQAECKSWLFRFIDDLEVLINNEQQLELRSASRTGYSDMGVNRRRAETLIQLLKQQGVIH